jgi:hypothetical protein
MQVDRASQFKSALATLVTSDLVLGYYPCRKPPDWCISHNSALLEMTLHRHLYTRAAYVTESALPDDRPSDILARGLLRVFNGDWRKHYIEHYCSGIGCPCGGSLHRCMDTCLALLQSVLCETLGERVPSTSRWWAICPTLEAQCLALVLHNVLGRVSDLASHSVNAVQLQEGAEDSIAAFRLYNAKKDKTAKEFVGSPEAALLVSVAAAVGEPVDHLLARLQRLDVTGRLLGTCGFCFQVQVLVWLGGPSRYPLHAVPTEQARNHNSAVFSVLYKKGGAQEATVTSPRLSHTRAKRHPRLSVPAGLSTVADSCKSEPQETHYSHGPAGGMASQRLWT